LDVLTLRGSVFSEETIPDSAGRALLGLYKSQTLGGGLELEYETRDVPENPTLGLYYRSYLSTAVKDYESAAPQGNLDVRRYESDAEWVWRMFGRHLLDLQIHGRLLQSDEDPIPLPDLYRLGGTRTLRGYREDQFAGSAVGWAAVEYRIWLDKLSRVYAFFNLGYWEYEPPLEEELQQGWPWGYGVGLRQGTPLGIIGFDFALGEGDALATAKVHFRLVNKF
jgi:outer membrane protein insertion porin family